MKRALVLGGTQFFGKRLVQNLLDAGWEVTIATRGKTPDTFGDRVHRLMIDREDKQTLKSAFGTMDTYWDSVFDQTCYSPIEAKDVAEVLNGRIGHYVFTSTMAVYDYGTRLIESDYNPNTYPIELRSRKEYVGIEGYREAKRQAEAVLFQTASFSTTAVRFPLVIGPDDYTGRLQFHVDRVKDQQPIGITNPHDRLSFITSEDAGRFLRHAAEEKLIGPFNAGSPGDLSLQELLDRIASATEKQAITVAPADRESRSPYDVGGSLSLDVSKAASAGYRFSEMDDAIGELIMHYLHKK